MELGVAGRWQQQGGCDYEADSFHELSGISAPICDMPCNVRRSVSWNVRSSLQAVRDLAYCEAEVRQFVWMATNPAR